MCRPFSGKDNILQKVERVNQSCSVFYSSKLNAVIIKVSEQRILINFICFIDEQFQFHFCHEFLSPVLNFNFGHFNFEFLPKMTDIQQSSLQHSLTYKTTMFVEYIIFFISLTNWPCDTRLVTIIIFLQYSKFLQLVIRLEYRSMMFNASAIVLPLNAM
jgi:hypothetical protein